PAAAIHQPMQDLEPQQARQADVQDPRTEGLVLRHPIRAQPILLASDGMPKTTQPTHKRVGCVVLGMPSIARRMG
ncbi:hypothetical protein, partial [Achromobacter xylosoxidans]|uniref:hypothetical protein n=1 Tax=Alcaligenes xylosoxydans xylosoxydans TaxID=85698 RepID=UPI001C644718